MGTRAVVKAEPIREGRAERITYPNNPRLQRLRFFSNLLDQCITLPGGMRIGIDPIIGLVPAVGDIIATALSLYFVYEAARLGLPKRVLVRMLGNVALESLMGTFPILGDIFDAVWKANMRNMRLVELHYTPTRPERSKTKLVGWIFATLFVFVALYVAAATLVLRMILSLFGALFGAN